VILRLGQDPSESLEGGSITESNTEQAQTEDSPSLATEGEKLNEQSQHVSSEMPGPCTNSLNVTTHNVEDESQDTVNKNPQSHLTSNSTVDPQSHLSSNGTNDNEHENAAEQILFESPPQLTEIITLGDPTIDIHEKIANWYQEDRFFTQILDQPHAFKNFELSNGRIFLKDNNSRTLCIPNVLIGKRRV